MRRSRSYFYIQSGKVKVTVVPKQAKKQLSAFSRLGNLRGMSEWSDAPHRDREKPWKKA